jgi:hypothetical protein
MGKWAFATSATDRFAETTQRVPMTRLGSELARDFQRMADLVDGIVADQGSFAAKPAGARIRKLSWLKCK